MLKAQYADLVLVPESKNYRARDLGEPAMSIGYRVWKSRSVGGEEANRVLFGVMP
jgi:hypothetical protein